MTIFDLITSNELQAYWEEAVKGLPPYLGESLFDEAKKLGLDIKWIKGAKGLPVVLKPSAFDAAAIPRKRIGFDKISAQMPYFKESMYIDEELRQQLNMALETGNDAYITSIIENVFDDEMNLLKGARAQRERMRMMALTTGVISITANGQDYDYDYGLPGTHKVEASVSWSNAAADIIEDIRTGIDKIYGDTGVKPTRAVCTGKTFGYMRKNDIIKKSLLQLTNGTGYITDEQIKNYIFDILGIEIAVDDQMYVDESGTPQKFVQDDTFTLFPAGNVGTFTFGTTPEESDLLSGTSANVSVVDTGVAICTSKKIDPVNVDTKVSMICLPSLPVADQIYIIDVING